VSLYGLSIEPNTPFQKAKQRGQLIETDDDTWARMYGHIVDTFTAAGLERYEVSNFARPGHRAVHNEAVWRGGFYAGLGPGAHGFRPSGERTQGASQLESWFEDLNHEVHLPSDSESAIDFILSTVRHVNGMNLVQLKQRTGFELNASQLSRLRENRQIHIDKESIRLQQGAFPLADGVVRALINALEPSHLPLTHSPSDETNPQEDQTLSHPFLENEPDDESFSISLDDSILNEALASVDKNMGRRRRKSAMDLGPLDLDALTVARRLLTIERQLAQIVEAARRC
jgi:hypothetical protein